MKIGTEDRRKVAAAVALVVFAVLLVGRWIFGSESSASASTDTRRTDVAAVAKPSIGKAARRIDTLDPTLRLAQLESTENEGYEGSGRNIFQSYGEDTLAKKTPAPRPEPSPDSSPAIAMPTIPLKFFGLASVSNAARRACLTVDGEVFIGGEGDIVDRRYKIVRIDANAVDVEDLIRGGEYTLRLRP